MSFDREHSVAVAAASNEAQYQMLCDAILREDEYVNFCRTNIDYGGADRSRAFARYANRMMDEGGTVAATTIALMIFPALKWLMGARKIDDCIAKLSEMDVPSMRQMISIQTALAASLHGKPTLRLQHRTEFFAQCEELMQAVEEAVDCAVFRNTPPTQMGRIVLAETMLRGETADGEPIPTRTVQSYFVGIVHDVAAHSGDEIADLVDALAPSREAVKSAEQAYLYHNIDVLLREYARITNPSDGDGRSLRLLNALHKGQQDALDKASDESCTQAYYLAQYASLIRAAVEMVRDYPGDGELYTVLQILVDEKYGPARTDEAILARKVGMSTSKFSEKKKRALLALGAVLWGCDVSALLELLQ